MSSDRAGGESSSPRWAPQMRLHPANQSRLLRRDGVGLCKYCGTPVEWFDRKDGIRIPLTPEVPSHRVPANFRWHVDYGVAHAGADPQRHPYCRIPHPAVCPALLHDGLPKALEEVVRRLAVQMRRRIDEGRFVPALPPQSEDQVGEPEPEAADEVRHTISYTSILRLAPGPIEQVRCVARSDGERCTSVIFDDRDGEWGRVEIPKAAGRKGQLLKETTGGWMWVWSLRCDITVGRRWLAQRCLAHGAFGDEPDHVPLEWVDFRPLRHEQFILTNPPPGTSRAVAKAGTENASRGRTVCATTGCSNATVRADVEDNWRCWTCEKVAKRRVMTERRWQQRGWHRPDNS